MAFNPKMETITQLQGIDQTQNPEQSSNELYWRDGEGHEETFQPYFFPHLPVNLWGWDIMNWIGVYLYFPNTVIANQVFQQGLLPNQGLGKESKGRIDPIIPADVLPGQD